MSHSLRYIEVVLPAPGDPVEVDELAYWERIVSVEFVGGQPTIDGKQFCRVWISVDDAYGRLRHS